LDLLHSTSPLTAELASLPLACMLSEICSDLDV